MHRQTLQAVHYSLVCSTLALTKVKGLVNTQGLTLQVVGISCGVLCIKVGQVYPVAHVVAVQGCLFRKQLCLFRQAQQLAVVVHRLVGICRFSRLRVKAKQVKAAAFAPESNQRQAVVVYDFEINQRV